MNDADKDKLALNTTNAWRMASNWVMAAAGAMFAVYLALPVEQQAALVAHLPVPPWVLPIVTSVIGVVARLWPQKAISPAVAQAKASSEPTNKENDVS